MNKSNPFRSDAVLNRPLSPDLCLRIYVSAQLAQFANERRSSPPREDRQSTQCGGQQPNSWIDNEFSLGHPAAITTRFTGVTLAVYQEIQRLYCSTLQRDAHTIWQILARMAEDAQVAPISFEAVWAICQFHTGHRERLTRLHIEHLPQQWWLLLLEPPSTAQIAPPRHPLFACIVDDENLFVIASKTSGAHHLPLSAVELIKYALYDALTLYRYPTAYTPHGLTWPIPACLLIEEGIALSEADFWHYPYIPHQMHLTPPASIMALHHYWRREELLRHIQPHRQQGVFDSYVQKVSGYGPLRIREQQQQRFRAHRGYQQNPASLFPFLRTLLPAVPSTITAEGTICHQGYAYYDNLLPYWARTPVMVRQSEDEPESLWVYLDEQCHHLLCEAKTHQGSVSHSTYEEHRCSNREEAQ